MNSHLFAFLAAATLLAATSEARTASDQKPHKTGPSKLHKPATQAATAIPNGPELRGPSAPSVQLVVGGSNDCATPDAISGPGAHNFDTTAATTGTQGQNEALCNLFGTTGIASDVWFRWTAGFTGTARVSMCAGTSHDAKLAVYAGSTCPAAAALACDDDFCGANMASQVNFSCTSGQPYMIQIGHYPTTGTPGTGSFTVTQIFPPANDNCTTPTPIGGGAGPHNFDTTNATQGTQGQANCNCLFFGQNGIGTDVWFSWTAPTTGAKVLELCINTPASLDAKVAVYTGAGCPAATAIACDDDGCGFAAPSTLTFNATAGTTYSIQVGSYPFPGQGGTGQFTINPVAGAPANDQCTAPALVTGPNPHPFDNTNATTGGQGQCESACDAFGTTMIANDVWHRWVATFTGPAQVELCSGTSMDSKVAVYGGTACPSGGALGCDDDACGTIGGPSRTIFDAVTGFSYVIQIGNYPGTTGGPGTFTIDPFTPAPGDLCSAPLTITGVGTFPYDNTQMTTGTQGQNESLCLAYGTTNIANDMWMRWTATCSGSVTVSMCVGGTHDARLAVYSGTACPAGAALACDDDLCGVALPSEIVFTAVSGQSYVFQLGSYPGAAPGAGTFTIACGGGSPMTAFCFPGQGGIITCPCNNPPTAGTKGCNNFGAGPAASCEITAAGQASIANDTLTFTSTGENNTSLTIFLQGPLSSSTGVVFGAGVRCAAGTLKRLYTGNAAAGTISRPQGADPNVHTRSATLGDTLTGGSVRYYFPYYRDPGAAAGCTNPASTFNCGNSGMVTWSP